MKIAAFNRHPDMQPMIDIEAESEAERQQLTKLYADLRVVQRDAVPRGKAGRHNVCGSGGSLSTIGGLSIEVKLGGELGEKKRCPFHPEWVTGEEDRDDE